jgi:hypothetical protein
MVRRMTRKSAMHGESGYARIANDLYSTEEWITHALCHTIRLPAIVWECACGTGRMSAVLEHYTSVVSTDLFDHGYGTAPVDFLTTDVWPVGCAGIVTNPPYSDGKAEAFLRRALDLALPRGAMLALLLRHEFDCAVTRRTLFEIPEFAAKITLLKRPRWIADTTESPRFNYAWYVYQPDHRGGAVNLYVHPDQWETLEQEAAE